MKHLKKYKFSNSELQYKIKNIIEAYLVEDNDNVMPTADEYDNDVDDDGKMVMGYAIDVPAIEDSFLYSDIESRDKDYAKLLQLIDLSMQLA